ncbi:MAG: NfeD family protein [Anaerolineaceae bacterium]|nr:NfeD family protein [Anaerolineaceae bacterium]
MLRKFAAWLWLVWLMLSLGVTAGYVQAQNAAPVAILLTAKGPLTPIIADYLERGLQTAVERRADVIVLVLDTPGGAVDTMNRMIQVIRSSSVPVVVYVSPRGAIAGSAGTMITLAGHVAAMAPETTIGAASPVGLQGEEIGETLESKVKEILKATARALTTARGPEATRLAEATIETARAVTVEEALEAGLVDLRAADLDDLLEKLDGRTVKVQERQLVLNTRNASVVPIRYTLIEDILQLLVNPNLVFLLLAIGVQALLIELSNPGGWFAGFIGVTCLLLAIYGLGILPVNWFGILFIVVAIVLFILELTTPTFGMLTAAGTASFIAGALILFNTARLPGFPPVSTPLVVVTGILFALTFLAVAGFAIRAQRTPIQTGKESLPGQLGVVRSELNPYGTVHAAGELWGAELIDASQAPLGVDERVEIVAVQGLTLKVRKAK